MPTIHRPRPFSFPSDDPFPSLPGVPPEPHAEAKGSPGSPSPFPPTRWTLVRTVQSRGPASEEALAELCRHYWFPVFAFLRRRGKSPADAEDLTQGFFASLLSENLFDRATPDRGRLRTFMLHALQHFLVDEHRRASRLKRGGNVPHVSLEFTEGEQRYRVELIDDRDPEALFHQAWSRTVVAQSLGRLKASYGAAGKAALFDAIEPHLESENAAVPYRDLAARLQTTDTALRLVVFRARQKLRSLIEEEIARTLSHPDDLTDEIQSLFSFRA